jgi:hypothetical protein
MMPAIEEIPRQRVTVSLSDAAHRDLVVSAKKAGLSVSDYVRRALAMQRALARYVSDDGMLVVVDQTNEREVHVHVVA